VQSEISLRQLTTTDGDAYASLMAASPDTGRISASQHFEIDAYQALAAMHGNFAGVVVEHSRFRGLVGGGLVTFGKCQFEGGIRSYALLNTLVVHPSFRRRGIASQLARWRLNFAEQKVGSDGVIWAIIQQGNIGSESTARKWQRQLLHDRLLLIPLRPRKTSPRLVHDYRIGPVPSDKFKSVSEQLNGFYQSFNMFTARSETELAAWCARTPFEEPFRHFLIVRNDHDDIVAGLVVTETYRLRSLHIVKSPLVARLANRLFHIVPSDYIVREIGLSHIWFAPGQQKAARYLLDTIRWEWRNKASSFMVWIDELSPCMGILDLHPWTLKTTCGVAIQCCVTVSERNPFYYE